jgi:hypothetical protein
MKQATDEPPLLPAPQTSIGPKGDMVGYLRPETAQVSCGDVWGMGPDWRQACKRP